MKSATYLLLHGLALTSYASTIEVTANVSIPPPVSGYFQLEKKVTDDIQYDNLTASALPVVGSGVGTYEYITYNAFTLLDGSDDVVGGVAIHTLPNAIDTTSEQQGTNGTPSLAVAKPYTSIGLVDFWFGCSTHTGESLANLATQCSVTVAAYQSSSDKQVALAVFEFTPPAVSVASVPMIQAVLPSEFFLPGIKNVTIVQDDPTTEALLIDSVSYYLSK